MISNSQFCPGSFVFTFCFSIDGKGADDAREQANRTGDAVLFFEGIFRYVLLPNDPTLYEYTTKEDVFDLSRKVLRNYIIKEYGIDPETYKPQKLDTKHKDINYGN